MIAFYYDRTMEGLLSAVFDAYKHKVIPDCLLGNGEFEPLFTTQIFKIETTEEKTIRVGKLLKKKMPREVLNMLNAVWLSEEEGSDWFIFQFIIKAIDSKFTNHTDFGDGVALKMHQLAKKVYKEKNALEQFVRFQRSKDEVYFAPVTPLYNALPLAINHFVDRFSFQQWIIYDLKRKYGFYYDLKKVQEITLESEESHLLTGKLDENLAHEEEQLFQTLWKNYFKAIAIKERINLKQQKQYMPKRF